MFEDLLTYAKENDVPIIKDGGLEVIINEINNNSFKSCLEIGTAIGYSAIRIASFGLTVTSIERNQDMYNLAIKNIKNYNLDNKIEVVLTDALEYTPTKKYDLIFIDAAKAQNIKFFERFSPFLNDGGEIIVDNLDFHGLTDANPDTLSKNLRSLTRKINEFKEWLKNNDDFITTFTHAGDGMSISKRK